MGEQRQELVLPAAGSLELLFGAFSLSNVLHGDYNRRGIAFACHSSCIEEKRAPACGRELSLDFDWLELITSGYQHRQGNPDAGGFPIVVAQVAQGNAFGLFA